MTEWARMADLPWHTWRRIKSLDDVAKAKAPAMKEEFANLFRELPAVVPGDYVRNEEEKECDCGFLTYWFRQELPRIGTHKAPQRRNRQCRLRPEMESSNVKNKSSGKRKMSSEDTRSYFAWNLEIERVLADVLRDQRNLGNKGDGNWKAVA
ncbi:hypothetical protein JHK82_012385 [Glycine max]|nr:hypothetical protein JHK82_012385 [Glycine max]